jgi:hypothetical protein
MTDKFSNFSHFTQLRFVTPRGGSRSLLRLEEDLRIKMRKLDEKLEGLPHWAQYSHFWTHFGELLMFSGCLIDDVLKLFDEGQDITDREFWIELKTRLHVIQTFLDHVYDVVESYLEGKL